MNPEAECMESGGFSLRNSYINYINMRVVFLERMRSSLVVRAFDWVRSQHPSAHWNLRGGRCSSVEYSTKKSPPKKYYKKKFCWSTVH
jgi:hypothetical protein